MATNIKRLTDELYKSFHFLTKHFIRTLYQNLQFWFKIKGIEKMY